MAVKNRKQFTYGKNRARNSELGMTLLEMMIVLAIIAVVMGLLVGPRVIESWNRAQEDTTKLLVTKLANEAYPQWTMTTRKACPDTLLDLQRYSNQKGTKDQWDNELVMLCGDDVPESAYAAFVVLSTGPDGKQGTSDDIKSWE
jgi:prepilin-type N-terminal cleavage/methylation domain-containing protein